MDGGAVRVRARARQRDNGETGSARERGRPEVFDESSPRGILGYVRVTSASRHASAQCLVSTSRAFLVFLPLPLPLLLLYFFLLYFFLFFHFCFFFVFFIFFFFILSVVVVAVGVDTRARALGRSE